MTASLALFIASLGVLAYTYAGYPLLMAARAAIWSRPVRRSAIEPTLVIVIVVYNGAAVIRDKLRSCLGQDYPAGRLAVLVVSDGSTDATCSIVEAMADARVELLAFPLRRGKAACLNDAVSRCTQEVIVFTDARQRLESQAVRHLVANFADPEIGAVSGQLILERQGASAFGMTLGAYWSYEKRLRRYESRVHSTVGVTGALYALRRECFREIAADTVLDDVLIPMNVVLQGRRVGYEDLARAYDSPSGTVGEERLRKVRTLAGNFQLLSRRPDLLVPWHNPIALQFVSHKVMRLLSPPALLGALLASALLAPESRWFAGALAAQLAGYACAAVGALSPPANNLRAVRFANAFVTMNCFVVLGLVEFLSNRRMHLWRTPHELARQIVTAPSNDRSDL